MKITDSTTPSGGVFQIELKEFNLKKVLGAGFGLRLVTSLHYSARAGSSGKKRMSQTNESFMDFEQFLSQRLII